MPFEFHSDAGELLAGLPAGNEALGLWVACGSWASAHGESTSIPMEVVHEQGGGTTAIATLVASGLWTEVDGAYKMGRGPSTDWPLPLWRFGDNPDDGRLITVLPEPD